MVVKFYKIPIKNTTRTFDIRLDKLPNKYEKVIEALKSAHTNLHVWVILAMAYFEKCNTGAFIMLLEESHRYASLDYEDSKLDKMKTLDMLSSHYIQSANRERSPIVRDRLVRQATRLYTKTDKMLMYSHNHLLGRAYYSLWMANDRNEENTKPQFKLMLKQLLNDTYTPVELGQICSSFKKKDYNSALRFFKDESLTQHLDQKDVQLGIAFCYVRLGYIKNAITVFEQILSVDAFCTTALTSIAAIRLGNEKSNIIQLGINMASNAFLIDEGNPTALYNLSNNFFAKHDYENANFFAKEALKNSYDSAMKSEISYHIAKSFHLQKNFEQAFHYYSQSIKFAPKQFIAPLYGLGQIYIYNHDIENGIWCFEQFLRGDPYNSEALKTLNILYTESNDQKKRDIAKIYFERIIRHSPNNEQAWTYLARILEKTDSFKSLIAYTKALKLMIRNKSTFCPPEMFNNIAALNYRLNNYDTSRIQLEESLRMSIKVAEIDPMHFNPLILSTKYNLGRSMEKLNKLKKAETLYKEIIKENPKHIDCYLRLGCIATKCHKSHEAFNWYKKALSEDHQNTDAWKMLEKLHINNLQNVAKNIRIKRNPSILNDPNALTTLGNYWLQALYDTLENENKGIMYEVLALEYFTTVLKTDTTNIWAANGIDCVLANNKCFFTARDVFYLIATVSTNFHGIWLNIANAYFEKNQYSSAIKMYEYCIKQLYNHNNDKILQWLGIAYFKTGQLKKAKNVLLKALKIAPQDTAIMYNVASVLQKLSVQILKYEKSDLKDVLQAVSELKVSQKYFQYLSVNKKYKKYDDSLYIFEARVSQTFLNDAKYYVELACVREDKESKILLEIQMELEALITSDQLITFNILRETRTDILKHREYKEQLKGKKSQKKYDRKQNETDQVTDASECDKPKYSAQDNKQPDIIQYKKELKNEAIQKINTKKTDSESLPNTFKSHSSKAITSKSDTYNEIKHNVSKISKKSSYSTSTTRMNDRLESGSANGSKINGSHFGKKKKSGLQAKLNFDTGLEKTSASNLASKSNSMPSAKSGNQDNKQPDIIQYKKELKNEAIQKINTKKTDSVSLPNTFKSHSSKAITSKSDIYHGIKQNVSKISKKSFYSTSSTRMDDGLQSGSANCSKINGSHFGKKKKSGLQAKLNFDTGLEKTSASNLASKSNSMPSAKTGTQDNKQPDRIQYKKELKNEAIQKINTKKTHSKLLPNTFKSHLSKAITPKSDTYHGIKHNVSKMSKKSSYSTSSTRMDDGLESGSANGSKMNGSHFGSKKKSGLQAKLNFDTGLEKTSASNLASKSNSMPSAKTGTQDNKQPDRIQYKKELKNETIQKINTKKTHSESLPNTFKSHTSKGITSTSDTYNGIKHNVLKISKKSSYSSSSTRVDDGLESGSNGSKMNRSHFGIKKKSCLKAKLNSDTGLEKTSANNLASKSNSMPPAKSGCTHSCISDSTSSAT